MEVKIPYGKTKISFQIDESRVITSKIDTLSKCESGFAEVRRAMDNPIGSKKLSELAKGKKDAVIIISDHTRPVPSKDIIPNMLADLREGNPNIDVTLLVATGFHRPTTKDELISKLGEEIVKNEKIVIHDSADDSKNTKIGVLPSGAELIIDKVAANTELLVAEGFIEPHFFAGFSGGRKSVLPGVSSRVTVLGNHCGEFIASKYARTGILQNNPINRDMMAAAKMANLAFIVNVVIDAEKDVSRAFAGDFEAAHNKGVEYLRKYCEVPAVPGDIVITSNGGAPLDQNLYQCVKGMTAAEATVNSGGTIIMCAYLADGSGGEGFYRSIKECESVQKLFDKFAATLQNKTVPDQWESQILCRILSKYRVIVVTQKEREGLVTDMKMDYAPDIETALEMAGKGSITVIPDGVSVMIKN